MARRRADKDSFAFDLEPDAEPGTEPDAVPAVGAEDGGAAPDDVPHDVSGRDDGVAARLARLPFVRLLVPALAAVTARVRSWPRRRDVAAVVALVLAGAGTAGVRAAVSQARVREWARIAATAPGAVLDLSHAPVEQWRVSLVRPAVLGVVGDVLVVREEPAAGAGTAALTGVDPMTGRVAWRTTVPGTADCQVSGPGQSPMPEGRVADGTATVCVAPDRRSVVVVAGDGTTLADRALADVVEHDDAADAAADAPDDAADAADADDDGGADRTVPEGRVLVAPDGALVRIDYLGDPVPVVARAELEPDAGQGGDDRRRTMRLTAALATRDVRVRSEDAATGDVRWQVALDGATLPAGAALAGTSACLGSWAADGTIGDPESQWSAALDATRLRLTQCGLDVVLDLATGAVVRQEDVTTPGYLVGRGQTVLLPDGGWAEVTWSDADGAPVPTSHVSGPDGAEVGAIPGVAVPVLATDGPRSALLLTSAWSTGTPSGTPSGTSSGTPRGTGSGGTPRGAPSEVAAYEAATAEPLWSRSLPRVRPVARTRDVVVVTDGATVTGLDRKTGGTRWSAPLDLPDRARRSGQPSNAYRITGALTDGQRVTIASQVDPEGYGVTGNLTVMTTFDLATGAVVWSTGPDRALSAVAGHLYRVGAAALTAVG